MMPEADWGALTANASQCVRRYALPQRRRIFMEMNPNAY